jgi:AcrR family transcriptional regulator
MKTPDAICEAAYRIYVTRGLPDLSMRNVAKKIGVTATALYRHFDGKEALVDAIADRGFEMFARDLSRPPASRRPRQRVFEILDRYRSFAFQQPHLFRLMFSTPRRRLRRFPSDFAAHRSTVFDALRSAVERGQRAGTFRPGDSLEVSLDLWAHAHGLLALYQAGRFAPKPRVFTALYRRSLHRLLRGIQT